MCVGLFMTPPPRIRAFTPEVYMKRVILYGFPYTFPLKRPKLAGGVGHHCVRMNLPRKRG